MANAPKKETITPQSLVTEQDVKKTLLADKGEDAQLISWNIVDFTKKGDNYACVVTSVEVKYSVDNQEQEVNYVVKLNPCRNVPAFEEMTTALFMKETKFYLNIVPELNSALTAAGQEPLRFPRCFHRNLETKKEQIYLEDLRARGFKMFDRKKGMDKDHTTLVLRELARLHAASYLLQAKTPDEALEVKHDFLLKDWYTITENAKETMGSMVEMYLTSAAAMLRKVGGYETTVSWIEGLKPKMEDIFTNGMKSEKFGSICHGDCWNNNILFRYNDEGNPIEVMLLDLQICRKASLASDLNYLLYTSLTGDVRTPNLSDFLSTYFSSYKDIMDAAGFDMYFTEDELLMEFRDKNLLGAIFGMIIIPSLLKESDEATDFSGKDGVDIEKIMKDSSAKSLEMLDTNPLMKPRFLAIFDEFLETGLIS